MTKQEKISKWTFVGTSDMTLLHSYSMFSGRGLSQSVRDGLIKETGDQNLKKAKMNKATKGIKNDS